MAVKSRILASVSSVDAWLVAALAFGAWLRFSRLGDFDNQYYTATVASMLKSPSNFLFASFDPGGVVSVDKPPLSFWVQAVPVALFGPTRWAVTLPENCPPPHANGTDEYTARNVAVEIRQSMYPHGHVEPHTDHTGLGTIPTWGVEEPHSDAAGEEQGDDPPLAERD